LGSNILRDIAACGPTLASVGAMVYVVATQKVERIRLAGAENQRVQDVRARRQRHLFPLVAAVGRPIELPSVPTVTDQCIGKSRVLRVRCQRMNGNAIPDRYWQAGVN
jgi:hypothetical protein